MIELATGTVAGRHHRDTGSNNQDAFHFAEYENCTIAIVCDGCGSENHSEVGAKLGARLVVEAIRKHAHLLNSPNESPEQLLHASPYWEGVRQDVLASLRVLISSLSNQPHDFSKTVYSHFLFTLVGALVTKTRSTFFSIGDGIIIVNGNEIRLGPFPDNQPPFIGYGLTGTSLKVTNSELLKFQIHRSLPTDELESFLIGTDGVEELMESADVYLPGKDEKIGLISQFWEEDRFFTNPDMINRRLRLINRDICRPDWEKKQLNQQNGRLHDDTTFVVGRRRQQQWQLST